MESVVETSDLANGLRKRLASSWTKSWLFFRFEDGVVDSMLVSERGANLPLESIFAKREVNDALHEIPTSPMRSGSEIRSGAFILQASGESVLELGYDEPSSDNLVEEFERLRAKYFPRREVVEAQFDPD